MVIRASFIVSNSKERPMHVKKTLKNYYTTLFQFLLRIVLAPNKRKRLNGTIHQES